MVAVALLDLFFSQWLRLLLVELRTARMLRRGVDEDLAFLQLLLRFWLSCPDDSRRELRVRVAHMDDVAVSA